MRTTNPIESTFAEVRHRTKVTKIPGSRAAGLAMTLKLIESGAMRSNTARDSTFWMPRMMSLILPWFMPQAIPIWVWLAPAYCCTPARVRSARPGGRGEVAGARGEPVDLAAVRDGLRCAG
jgi:hypothetical protein